MNIAAASQQDTIKALQAVGQNRWEVGRELTARAHDPLAVKLYYWLSYTQNPGLTDYTGMVQFIRRNPDWPGISALTKDAESHMPSTMSPHEIIAWFSDYPPATAAGLDRYLGALIAGGRQSEAKKILSDWWAQNTMPREDQRHIFRIYGQFLTRADHQRRFDALLLRGSNDSALAIADVLGKGYPELAAARIALRRQNGNVNALINRVPASLRKDPGLLYERLRWRRKNDLDAGAVEILRRMPSADKIHNLEDWWKERHIIIRRLSEKKDWKNAYALAAAHKQKEGLSFAQAEWLAGFLALRYLHQPARAYTHFDKLYRGVSSPISQARAAYWAGRASEGFKDKTISQRWYKIAAAKRTTFYGQMAAAELRMADSLPHMALPTLTSDDKTRMESQELMRAAILLARAGLHKQAAQFFKAFTAKEDTPAAYYFAAHKAADLDLTNTALSIAKQATNKGMFLTAQSYPVITGNMRGVNLEWALVHSIIRQESMFDTAAQSPAGALGLMQLMPATAREVAGKAGLSYSHLRLTSDPSYNITLGSSYLGRLLKRYDGSYPLAIAAYNAGPGRVDQWIKTFGDPRIGQVSLIDWIELIPIYETRNYVQRVMEAVYIYRLRLHDQQPRVSAPLHVAQAQP